MKYRVIFGPRAVDDLENLLSYLAPEMGVGPARDYVRKIETYCLGFETFPKRGLLREDLRPGLRLVGYRYRATIAFFVEQDLVIIARIFHRGRDVDMDDADDV